MASLPSDRTKLALAQSNQNPQNVLGSSQNKNAITEAYDTIDLLNQKVDGLVGSVTLSPYPPAQYNRLINGGFAVNQRVVSGTVTLAAGAYGHDRWKAGAAGCTYTFATVNNVTTITITAGSLIQVIEGINLASGTHTLSWTGTSQGKIGAGSYSASGVNSSITGGTNLSIEFNVGTLSIVQFNFGSISLPFQPRNFAEEFALCQRYYEPLDFNALLTVIRAGTASIYAKYPFKVRKRVSPTLANASDLSTTIGPGSKQVSFNRISDNLAISATGNITIAGDGATFMTPNIGSFIFSAATSFSGTTGDILYIVQTTKDTLIGFDAEL